MNALFSETLVGHAHVPMALPGVVTAPFNTFRHRPLLLFTAM
jgi:hypothetical protein